MEKQLSDICCAIKCKICFIFSFKVHFCLGYFVITQVFSYLKSIKCYLVYGHSIVEVFIYLCIFYNS